MVYLALGCRNLAALVVSRASSRSSARDKCIDQGRYLSTDSDSEVETDAQKLGAGQTVLEGDERILVLDDSLVLGLWRRSALRRE